MAWIEVIDEEEATAKLAEVYQQIAGRRGKVANIMSVHSLMPHAMQAHMNLYLAIMFERSGLSREEREMVATAVSSINRCEYCKHHHGEALKAYWDDPHKVESFMIDWRSIELDDRQQAMLAYAERLTLRPDSVTEADIDALRDAGFDDASVLALNLVTSYFNFVNRIAEGLGVAFTPEEMTGYRY